MATFISSSDYTLFLLYTLVFVFFSACFIAPPTEFVSAGVTIQNIFSHWLGSEDFNFVYYHIRRTSLTLVVHALIPLAYYFGLGLFAPQLRLFNPWDMSGLWLLYLSMSLLLVVSALGITAFWHLRQNVHHPLVKQLTRLAGEGSSWRAVASSVNVEFRRIDKFTSGIPSRLVVVTDSWIIKTSTYFVDIAHQNDIHLTLAHAEEHPLSYHSQTAVQYLNITVGRVETGAKPFNIRDAAACKGEADGETGIMSQALNQATHHQGHSFKGSEDMCEFLSANYGTDRRHYFHVENIERLDLPEDALMIPGTRKYHQFQTVMPYVVQARRLACFCTACKEAKFEKCVNLEVVGNFTVHKCKPSVDTIPNEALVELPSADASQSTSNELNSLELSDLKEKLQTPIRNARNIVIHQSLSDLFIKAFREQVGRNPKFVAPPEMEIEQCIGCMQKPSDVKLNLSCRDRSEARNEDSACVPCFCRPMWCLECMGKWFASRQDQTRPESWMSSKSPCPTCRAKFCVLDVCPIQE